MIIQFFQSPKVKIVFGAGWTQGI